MIIKIPKWKQLKAAIRIFANIVLMGFTIPMVSLAIYSKGALIYYYEPTACILIAEVILGLFAVFVSTHYVYEKLAEMI